MTMLKSSSFLLAALLLGLAGCASQVVVSNSRSITYEHAPGDLQDVGEQATKYCAKQGKETRMANTQCIKDKQCVTTFECTDK